jgi:hypothetical protein
LVLKLLELLELALITVIKKNDYGRLNLRSEVLNGPDYWEISVLQELIDLFNLGIVQQISTKVFPNE